MNSSLTYIENSLRGYLPDCELRETALWIIQETTGFSRSEILCKDTTNIPNLEIIIERLRQGEPLQYVFGKSYWGGLTLHVNSSTLIPRPETWELIEEVHRRCSHLHNVSLLDIGTGSGCIAIALKQLFSDWTIHACDISTLALQTAQENANENNADITFYKLDILKETPNKYDIIVSNPPYITQSEQAMMSSRVLDYEPNSALFVPDQDPLLFYRAIAQTHCSQYIFFEINELFGNDVVRLLQSLDYHDITLRKDIFGKDRVVSGA